MLKNKIQLCLLYCLLSVLVGLFFVTASAQAAVTCATTPPASGLCGTATACNTAGNFVDSTKSATDTQCTGLKCCICKPNFTFDVATSTCKAAAVPCNANDCKPTCDANTSTPDPAKTCAPKANIAQVCCIPKPVPKKCADVGGTCDNTTCKTGESLLEPAGVEDCKSKTPPLSFCCVKLKDCKTGLSGECIDKTKAATDCKDTKKTIDAIGCAGTEVCCVTSAAAGDTAAADNANPEVPPGTGDKFMAAAMSIFTVIFGTIIHIFSWVCGKLMVLEMEMLVFISGYNSFIRNTYVAQGWIVLRDLVNMFFVLGLLFIAFITVLRIEKQPWNKLLGKLLMMAILVNFSKTICGLVIDFFQVLMMTFVYAYKDITAGNIFSAFGTTGWSKFTLEVLKQNVDIGVQLGLLGSAILGLMLTVVSMVVILVFIIILMVRIVVLWILVVFSPLAFFSFSFQGVAGKVGQFGSMWWNEFLQYCMVGPFLAFFLWLSVATMAKFDVNQMVSADYYDPTKRAGVQTAFSAAGTMDKMLMFFMSILMLIVGLAYTQKFKVVGASVAGSALNKMKGAAKTAYGYSAAPLGRGIKNGVSKGWRNMGGWQGLAKMPGKAVDRVGKYGRRLEQAGINRQEALKKGIPGTQPGFAGGKVAERLGAYLRKGASGAEAVGKGAKWAREAPGKATDFIGNWAKKGRQEQWKGAKGEGKQAAKTTGGAIGRGALAGLYGVAEIATKGVKGYGKMVEGAMTAPFKIPLTGEEAKIRAGMIEESITGWIGKDYKQRREKEKKYSELRGAESGEDPANIDLMKKGLKDMKEGKTAYDPAKAEWYMRTLANAGQYTAKDYHEFQDATGFMQNKSKLEQALFGEELAQGVEKKNGRREAFSPYVFNPNTLEFDYVGDIEAGKEQAYNSFSGKMGGKYKPEQIQQIMSTMDTARLMKYNKDKGIYEIDDSKDPTTGEYTNKEYKRLENIKKKQAAGGTLDTDEEQQLDVFNGMQDMQKDYKAYLKKEGLMKLEKNAVTGQMEEVMLDKEAPDRLNHAFHFVVRGEEVQKKRDKDQRERITKQSGTEFGNFVDNKTFANFATYDGKRSIKDISDTAANSKFTGQLADETKEDTMDKVDLHMGTNDERIALLRSKAVLFKKEREKLFEEVNASRQEQGQTQRQNFDEITADDLKDHSKSFQDIDYAKDHMSIKDLEKIQDFRQRLDSEYDADHRVIPGKEGEGNESLQQFINQKKKDRGISYKIKKEVEEDIYDETPGFIPQQSMDDMVQTIDTDAENSLASTEHWPRAKREAFIRDRIDKLLNRQGFFINDDAARQRVAQKITVKLIDERAEVVDRGKDTEKLKKEVSVGINEIITKMSKLLTDKKDITPDIEEDLNFNIDAIDGTITDLTSSAGLRPEDTRSDVIKDRLTKMKDELQQLIKARKFHDAEVDRLQKAIDSATTPQLRKQASDALRDTEAKFRRKKEEWKNLQNEMETHGYNLR